MKRWLIVGAGDVAQRMAPLLKNKVRLFVLCRSPEKVQLWRQLGATAIIGDLDDRRTLKRISGIAEGLFYFAPPNNTIQEKDPRTHHLLSALSRCNSLPQHLIYISTTGVYGDHHGNWISETTPVNPISSRAKRRILAEQLLRHFAKRNRIKLIILRAPGIYADDRLPLERFKSNLPLVESSEDSWSNHIHALDLAKIAIKSMYHHTPLRIFNAVDEEPLQIGNYYDMLADHFNEKRALRLPKDQVKNMINEISWSFMAESRKIANQRLLKELSYHYSYPSVQSFLKSI